MVTAAALEGGDLVLIAPRVARCSGTARSAPRSRPPSRSRAGSRSSAGRCGCSPSTQHFVHIDVIVCMVAAGPRRCLLGGRTARPARLAPSARAWSRSPCPTPTPWGWGERDGARPRPGASPPPARPAERARSGAWARGLRRPTCGPSRWAAAGPHCLSQPLKREAVIERSTRAASSPTCGRSTRDRRGRRGAARVLDRRVGAAREFLRERLAELPVEVSRRRGGQPLGRAPRRLADEVVAVGSHLDSVPGRRLARRRARCDGGAGGAARRRLRRDRPRGRSRWSTGPTRRERASGAACSEARRSPGTLDPDAVRGLRDAEGVSLQAVLAATASMSTRWRERATGGASALAPTSSSTSSRGLFWRRRRSRARRGGLLRASSGTGSCSPGSRARRRGADGPPRRRRRRGGAPGRRAAGDRPARGGVCTVGRIDLEPGIVTAVPGRAEVLVDQRHLDPGALAGMLEAPRAAAEDAAESEGCSLGLEHILVDRPVAFHPAWSGRGRGLPPRPGLGSARSPAAPCTTPPSWRGGARRR